MNKYIQKTSLLTTCLLIVFILVGLFVFVDRAEATHVNPVGEQTDYRWRNDDGTESSATWKALVNTPITGVNDLDEMRIRIAVEETAGGNLKLDSQLEFGTNADCTSGTWTLISTTSSTWQLFDSSQFTEPVATVQRISSASFVAGQLLDQTNPAAAKTISSQVTEYEWAIKANGVAASTDYYFRISDKGTALNTYTVCAKLTTAAAGGISVDGRIFTDEGTTGLDCTTSRTVALSVNGGTPTTVECSNSPSNGSFSFSSISASATDILTIFLDGETEKATTVTETDGNNMTGIDLYTNHIIVRHDNAGSLTIVDMDNYDKGNDPDILFTATNAAPDTLTVDDGNELYIWTGDTFAPGGNLTAIDDIKIVGTYTATGTETITVSGIWTNNGTFTAANSTVTMDGIAESIAGTSNTSFYALTIDPATTGTITLTASDPTVTNTLTVADTDTLTLNSGRTLTHTGATLTLSGATGGTINGAGTLRFTDASGGPGVDGTISSIVRFDASAGNIASTTFDARTYSGQVEIFSDDSATANREVAFASGTYTTSGATSHLYVINNSNTYTLTLVGATNNPTVNIGGDLDFTGTGSSSEIITSGSGTWTVSGNTDFTGGTFTASSGNTFQMNGSGKNCKSNAQTFQGLSITGGSVSTTDQLTVAGNFNIANGATLSQGNNVDIILTGDSITIANGGTFNKASGTGKLIMDGTSGDQWFEDANATKQDLGSVQIGQSPGTTKLKSDFSATDLTILTGDTFETHGWEVDLSDFFDCQGSCTFDLEDDVPNNEGDGTIVTVGGNYTMSATGTFIPSTDSRVELDGTANQTVTTGGKAFYDFYVNNSGTTNDNVIISGTLDVDGTLTVNDGELEMSTNNPTVNTAGDVTFNTNATVTKGTGTWTFNGTTAATYTDSSSGGPQNIGVVVFNKTSGVAAQDKVTLASNMTVDTADIQTGDTLDLAAGSYILDLANAGATATVLTVTGTLTPGTSTVKYSATNSGGNVNITTTTYDSLQMAGNETYDLTGNLTTTNGLTGDLTIDLNATLDATASSYDIELAGSWNNNGTFTVQNSIVTFDSGDTGETVDAGSSGFYDATFNSGTGGWTIQNDNMTVSNNLTLTAASVFTVNSGITLEVGGTFDLTVSGANTTWTGSTLYLNGSGGMYEINTKTHGGDTFATLRVGASEDIAMWDSSASTYTIDAGGCLYSQDHGGTAGRLNIYGTCNSRTNEYWSYAKDFDGAAVTRQADVRFDDGASFTVDNGDTLEIKGQSAGANRSLVTRDSTGNYSLTISGTIDAQYYDFDYLDASGLNITSTATITELSDGSFDNNSAGGAYITVTGITSTDEFRNNVFDDNGDGTDTNVVYNVDADGSGINWTFLLWSGNKGGESYDNEINSAAVNWNEILTLTLSANTMNLGTINTLIIGTDNHNLTVTTTADNGYTCNAVEDGDLRNGTDTIDDVADGTVTAGSEEYGISCSGTDCQLANDSALSGTPLTIASNTGPVEASVTTVTYEAAAATITVGTNYSHIVTFTCTGDF